jgi:hypothetical protein
MVRLRKERKTMFKSMIHLIACVLIGCVLFIPLSNAGSYGITGTIISIGCQTVNGICLVVISGPAAGPPGCMQNQVRWDSVNTPNGNAAIAQLTAAYLSGKQVTINISDSCFAEFPSYPGMDYYIISG